MKLIAILRHETAGRILKAILARKKVSHSELIHDLSITSQGLTWQMNRLAKEGLIQENRNGMKLIYSLENKYTFALTELVNLAR